MDTEALLMMPSEERAQLSALLAKYAANRRNEDDDAEA
jgi:hypothetical protein